MRRAYGGGMGTPDANPNVRTIRDVYAAFGRGDVPAILDRLADDVRWVAHLESAVPWSGDHSGKPRVPRFFEAIPSALAKGTRGSPGQCQMPS